MSDEEANGRSKFFCLQMEAINGLLYLLIVSFYITWPEETAP